MRLLMFRRASYLGASFLRSESADDVDVRVDGLRVANRRLLELGEVLRAPLRLAHGDLLLQHRLRGLDDAASALELLLQ